MMAASCSTATQTVPSTRRAVPALFSDILDVAIYSFSCQSGLRAHHKVRGDPVLEGVSAMLGRMLLTSNTKTQAAFEEMAPTRLGNWKPGQKPTKELLTLISSRMKNLKMKGNIREGRNPVVPSLLLEKKQFFNEEEDRVKTVLYPTCWRIASPFLDLMEEILGDEDLDDQEDEEDEEELMSTEEVERNHKNLMRCLSGKLFPANDDDGEEEEEEEDDEDDKEQMDDEEELNDEKEVDGMEEVDNNIYIESSNDEKVTSEDEMF
ncbi:hypothetical protein ACROYT_G032375 [Oculina patagonica]